MGSLLLVGLNGDDSVRELKGDSRPVNCQEDRAAVLSAFEFVDYVYIFEEKRATDFLKLASPDIYVKAGDYDIDSIHEPERCMLNLCGAEIKFLPFIEGKSTTATLNKLNNGNK
jgi:rfaE bifunctional protein nucleotidyltransferase chain/domain